MTFITDQVRFRNPSFVCLFVYFLFLLLKSFLAPVSASNALKKSIREGPVTIISWIEACMSYSALVK